jgi:multimeric flavodoxin WrbA
MKIFKLAEEKKKVLIFQGSPRSKESCANMKPKTEKVIDFVVEHYSNVLDIEVIDLSIKKEGDIIQPCKGCYSTSGGYHCHWECDCYQKDGGSNDFLANNDIYKKLKECDAFLIFSPIHWHNLSSQIKTLFDRLVCCNLTMTVEEAKEAMGEENIKNSKVTGKYALKGEYDHVLKNHLEGKYCGFYVQGDDGADDYSDGELPKSYHYDGKLYENPQDVVMPYVLQCRYSGIFVPDKLIKSFYANKEVDYYKANLTFGANDIFFKNATELMENLLEELS